LRLSCGDLALVDFGSRKAAELLAFLALSEHRSLSREELSARLWPHHETLSGPLLSPPAGGTTRQAASPEATVADPEARRKRLRTELNRLRRALESVGAGELLKAERETIALVNEALVIDVVEFQKLRRQAARADRPEVRARLLDEAVRTASGPLDRSLDAELFARERNRLASALLAALIDLAQAQEEVGESAGARATLLRAVAMAPDSEEAHFHLIRGLIASGQEDAARRHYDDLLKTLQRFDPSEALRFLVAPLYRGGTASPPVNVSPQVDPQLPVAPTLSSGVAKRNVMAVSPSTPRLPHYSAAFFGREPEIALLMRLLSPHESKTDSPGVEAGGARAARLVTLTGPGGSGKTRLAVEAARRLAPSFEDAVWFLALADLHAPALIGTALLGVLNLPPQQEDLLQQAALVLERRPSLLLLDNMEHLLPAAAETVARLVALAPNLRLLLTSRHALHLSEGIEYPLAPLPLPQEEVRSAVRDMPEGTSPTQDRLPPSNLLKNAAVALFVDRARAVRSGFATQARSHATIVSICRELEGLPLALEIAAARASSFTPGQILDQVRREPLTLQSRSRDLDPKHRRLLGVIAGSYRLLTPAQQRLFRQLAIFRGFSAEAARVVCEIETAPAFLQEFVDRSLVTTETRADTARYRLLEILRAFGEAQWSEAERGQLTDRHFAFYLDLAEAAASRLRGPEARVRLDRLEAERDNLRAALERSCEAQEWERALQLASALAPFWAARSHFVEGRQWLAELLPYATPDTALRASALHGAGVLAHRQGDVSASLELLTEAATIRRQLGDEALLASTLHEMGMAHHFLNRFEEAREAHRESVALWRGQPDPDPAGLGRALHGLAMAARQLGTPSAYDSLQTREALRLRRQAFLEEAARLHLESQALLEEAGDAHGVAWSLTNQGILAAMFQGPAAARSYYQRSLEIYEALGDWRGVGSMLHSIGTTYPDQDSQKLRTLLDGLRILGDLGERKTFIEIVYLMALLEEIYHRYERATLLMAAADALRTASGLPQHPRTQYTWHEAATDWARFMPAGRFEQLWAEGSTMTYEQILAYALSDTK
jgi:predicted ATPase